MDIKPQVIAKVVDNDLCTGCGVCTYVCQSDALIMEWNEDGFLTPSLVGDCNDDSSCISVCPFNPEPIKEVKDESALADIFLSENTKNYHHLGRLINIYAGHSNSFRLSSSSGGLATFILDQLLDREIVKHIVSVRASNSSDNYYEFTILSTKEQLKEASKTRYYPVTLATVLPEIEKLDGPVAVTGIACFVKAIRLAQFYNPELKEKIPFVVGIICGGLKSSHFTDYLASRAGVDNNSISSPQYRIKNLESSAKDYSFGCIDKNDKTLKRIDMQDVGDMWGTGLFKANACDFCEDVVTELADISLGDAWLEPYRQDGRGNNVIITRNPLAELIIQDGIKRGSLTLDVITPDAMTSSQQGSFNHRHKGLPVRLHIAKLRRLPIAKKRHADHSVSIDLIVLHLMRMLTRKKSLDIWKISDSSQDFDRKMKKYIKNLKVITQATKYKRKIKDKLFN